MYNKKPGQICVCNVPSAALLPNAVSIMNILIQMNLLPSSMKDGLQIKFDWFILNKGDGRRSLERLSYPERHLAASLGVPMTSLAGR